MFDLGFGELLVIGITALIVIPPKDLPGAFRTMGRFTGKMRRMAREFQRAMEDAARESGVDDTARDLREMTSNKNLGLDRLNDAADRFEKWDPAKSINGRKPPKTGDAKAEAAKAEAAPEMGPETAKLAEERAATAERRREEAAARAADAAEPPAEPKPEPNAEHGP